MGGVVVHTHHHERVASPLGRQREGAELRLLWARCPARRPDGGPEERGQLARHGWGGGRAIDRGGVGGGGQQEVVSQLFGSIIRRFGTIVDVVVVS